MFKPCQFENPLNRPTIVYNNIDCNFNSQKYCVEVPLIIN